MIGTRVDGKYELSMVLGQGAMGIVYKARHSTTGREVALKLLHPGKVLAPQALERFQREARAMGTVADSLHAVQVLDAGIDPATGSPYIVMELLSGEDIDALLTRLGPLPVPLALRISAQALTGLIPAHDKGIVHRDLKPSNLFLMRRAEADPVVKVLDFGIAKMRAEGEGEAGQVKGNLTATNSTLGSPAYMSPEQVRGAKTLDSRSDLWSMGVVLYQLVSGALPFEADVLSAMLLAILNGVPVPLGVRAPWAPPEVAEVIEKAMQRDLARRYGSAREMRDEIVRLLGGAPGSSVTAMSTITEAMVAPLSLAERNLRPVAARMPEGVRGLEGPPPTGGFGGLTAPLTPLLGSGMPRASNVGNPVGATQPLSTLPGTPLSLPTEPIAGSVQSARTNGRRTGLVLGAAGFLIGLAALGLAVLSRTTSQTPTGNPPHPVQNMAAASAADLDGGTLPPVALDPNPGDAADAGVGLATASGHSAKPPSSPLPGTKPPPPLSPGTSKTNADPFKGSRSGK